MPGKLKKYDLTHELWREYDMLVLTGKQDEKGNLESIHRVYRIDEPQSLLLYPGSSTHRVIDKEGVAHCLPAPGFNGCVLRWKNEKDDPPARF